MKKKVFMTQNYGMSTDDSDAVHNLLNSHFSILFRGGCASESGNLFPEFAIESEDREHDMHNKLKIVHNNPPLNTLHAAC